MKKKILAFTIIITLIAAAVVLFVIFGGQHKDASVSLSENVPVTESAPSVSIFIQPQIPTAPSYELKVSAAPDSSYGNPRYVFIMIGDGMGEGQRELAQYYLRIKSGDGGSKLLMNTLPVKGEVKTRSADSSVTDSAASGTAYSTGHKTNNGMLAVSPKGKALKTIMEEAESLGMSTGVITTTSITDATPAAFSVHCSSRAHEIDIANAYLTCGIDFIAGGGAEHFLPSLYAGGKDTWGDPLISDREDSRNLFSEFEQKGYETFCGAEGWAQFKDFDPYPGNKVFAAFSNISLPYELDRINEGMDSPTLSEMTEKAICSLESDRDGFVIMVEGGRIDQACHLKASADAACETLAFDDAVKTAYEFYLEHPDETLIIVTADHETGGLSLDSNAHLSELEGVRSSIQGRLTKVYTEKGDRSAFYTYISENLGLSNLSASELKKIEAALNYVDRNKTDSNLYSKYNPPAIAASDIVSERARIKWAYFGHTGKNVPLTAIGWKSEEFSGTRGIDETGKLLFKIINLDRQ